MVEFGRHVEPLVRETFGREIQARLALEDEADTLQSVCTLNHGAGRAKLLAVTQRRVHLVRTAITGDLLAMSLDLSELELEVTGDIVRLSGRSVGGVGLIDRVDAQGLLAPTLGLTDLEELDRGAHVRALLLRRAKVVGTGPFAHLVDAANALGVEGDVREAFVRGPHEALFVFDDAFVVGRSVAGGAVATRAISFDDSSGVELEPALLPRVRVLPLGSESASRASSSVRDRGRDFAVGEAMMYGKRAFLRASATFTGQELRVEPTDLQFVELRLVDAAAAGLVVGEVNARLVSQRAQKTSVHSGRSDLRQRLVELKELMEDGLLSQEEYDDLRRRALGVSGPHPARAQDVIQQEQATQEPVAGEEAADGSAVIGAVPPPPSQELPRFDG